MRYFASVISILRLLMPIMIVWINVILRSGADRVKDPAAGALEHAT
jgi:hypothetical protein